VHLPVKDLDRSTSFFRALGFSFEPTFTDDRAACMVISRDAYVMLLVEDFYATFTSKQVVDATSHSEVILCLTASSREEVDELVHRAIALGGKPANARVEDWPVYGWSFQDVDSHLWELMFMDRSAVDTELRDGTRDPRRR
jgi:predicted lactoylglutathione lyase